MKNLFTSYQIALIAKEKGFNEPCFRQIGTSSKAVYNYGIKKNSDLEVEAVITLPLYQQVVDWLEIKGVSIWAYPVYRAENIAFFKVNMAKYYTEIDTQQLFGLMKDTFSTKEEALNKAIEEAFKLI